MESLSWIIQVDLINQRRQCGNRSRDWSFAIAGFEDGKWSQA